MCTTACIFLSFAFSFDHCCTTMLPVHVPVPDHFFTTRISDSGRGQATSWDIDGPRL